MHANIIVVRMEVEHLPCPVTLGGLIQLQGHIKKWL